MLGPKKLYVPRKGSFEENEPLNLQIFYLAMADMIVRLDEFVLVKDTNSARAALDAHSYINMLTHDSIECISLISIINEMRYISTLTKYNC